VCFTGGGVHIEYPLIRNITRRDAIGIVVGLQKFKTIRSFLKIIYRVFYPCRIGMKFQFNVDVTRFLKWQKNASFGMYSRTNAAERVKHNASFAAPDVIKKATPL
jgi:hypothetical protein